MRSTGSRRRRRLRDQAVFARSARGSSARPARARGTRARPSWCASMTRSPSTSPLKSVLVNGEGVPLARKDYEICALFGRHPGRCSTRTCLQRTCGASGGSSVVTEHVRRLRRALADAGAAGEYVSTVWGGGVRVAGMSFLAGLRHPVETFRARARPARFARVHRVRRRRRGELPRRLLPPDVRVLARREQRLLQRSETNSGMYVYDEPKCPRPR